VVVVKVVKAVIQLLEELTLVAVGVEIMVFVDLVVQVVAEL
jgi:hypothetical protein|tara:strand:- start:70 stop:192 length:123 start_codon:yes stop_codon:yes gene_type:complete